MRTVRNKAVIAITRVYYVIYVETNRPKDYCTDGQIIYATSAKAPSNEYIHIRKRMRYQVYQEIKQPNNNNNKVTSTSRC